METDHNKPDLTKSDSVQRTIYVDAFNVCNKHASLREFILFSTLST